MATINVFVAKPENYEKIYSFLSEARGLILIIFCKHSFAEDGGNLRRLMDKIFRDKNQTQRLTVFKEIPCYDLMMDGPILQEIL